jgi:hypothetical protein
MRISSLLQRFFKAPAHCSILLFVVGLHFFFLLMIFTSPSSVFHKKQHKSLIVKTVALPPLTKASMISERKKTQQNTISPPAPAINPPKKVEPVSKQQISKAESSSTKEQTSKKRSQKSTPLVKKDPPIADQRLAKTKQPLAKQDALLQNRAKISDSLLKELEESIAKIEDKSDKGTASKKPRTSRAPVPVLLQIDTPSNEPISCEDCQSDYTEILVNHLHQCLSLPDYGEVKIELILHEDGTVAKVIVLKTQSEKNRQYLESSLSRLKFPRFGDAYANKRECTFILTFCNE